MSEFSFGPFEYDFQKMLLSNGDQPVTFKPMELKALDFILRRRHRLITYDDLVVALWDDERFVEAKKRGERGAKSDNDVQKVVRPVSDTLLHNGHRFIEVVPKLGYRFAPDMSANLRPSLNAAGNHPDQLYLQSSGASGSIWHVPYARARLFNGRKQILDELHHDSKERSCQRTVQVLAGLSGFGKTSIAVEYAYRYRNDYRLVWWIDAFTEASLKGGYETLAARLGWHHGSTDLEATDYVSSILSATSDWLIIFDGVSSSDSVLPLLPRTGTGHIMITSADRSWKGTASVYDVPSLERQAALEFVDERLARMPGIYNRDSISQLADELRCIPGALELACTYLEQTACPIDQYLLRVRALRRESFLLFGSGHSAELLLADAWKLPLLRATCEAPSAYILLRLLEWSDDCEIPIALIEDLDAHEKEFIWKSLRVRICFWFLMRNQSKKAGTVFNFPLRLSEHVHTFGKALITLQRYSVTTVRLDVE